MAILIPPWKVTKNVLKDLKNNKKHTLNEFHHMKTSFVCMDLDLIRVFVICGQCDTISLYDM